MNNLRTIEPAGPAGTIHVSNLLTYVALLAGCVAASFAITSHHRAAAGAFMAVAVIADTFDGLFARMFDRTGFQSAFGVQLDSLADAVTCGFVPLIVLASDSTPATWGAALVWWGCAFLYALAAITRLGYYNLTHDNGPWFVGLPAPFCALVVSTSLLFSPHASRSVDFGLLRCVNGCTHTDSPSEDSRARCLCRLGAGSCGISRPGFVNPWTCVLTRSSQDYNLNWSQEHVGRLDPRLMPKPVSPDRRSHTCARTGVRVSEVGLGTLRSGRVYRYQEVAELNIPIPFRRQQCFRLTKVIRLQDLPYLRSNVS